MIIAIDGPSAAGKGVLARRLAAKYGLAYLDTGLLYRAVGHALLVRGESPFDEKQAIHSARTIDLSALDDSVLRGQDIGEAASIVAAMPAIRMALIDCQRQFAGRKPGAVLDGRDIGTVICPDAKAKLFVTANIETRAKRRFMELQQRGEQVSQEEILNELLRRDQRDTTRAASPLQPAPGAYLLDTSKSCTEMVFKAAVDFIDKVK